ncbi:hypothetical protein T03_12878 [Trichinella britovi]|uniref:Uncharacterized protein n=1 Tax=Trichinella britovi TaxID=45882 RepID=A0A0V1AH03_TRIBR|nr:hypothetical protein T06_9319 [Trichinella sp. T6]KRY24102.1 hypothetical protein T03_12878 [Trichinella britovi]
MIRGRHEPNHGPHEAEQEMRRGKCDFFCVLIL